MDHFNEDTNASLYVKYTVRFPDDMYRYMATLCDPVNADSTKDLTLQSSNRKLAIDLACGSGQSSVPIAKYFLEVIGVDISQSQIKYAPKDVSNVRYKVGPGENLDFVEDGSVDLVLTVAALHWLEFPEVFEEVKRVLRKGGVFCAAEYTDFGILYDVPEAGALWDQVRSSSGFI